MLVLRRNVGESFIVDDDIIVSVLAVEGARVKIGIRAPQCVSIVREELLPRSAQVPPEVQLNVTDQHSP